MLPQHLRGRVKLTGFLTEVTPSSYQQHAFAILVGQEPMLYQP